MKLWENIRSLLLGDVLHPCRLIFTELCFLSVMLYRIDMDTFQQNHCSDSKKPEVSEACTFLVRLWEYFKSEELFDLMLQHK